MIKKKERKKVGILFSYWKLEGIGKVCLAKGRVRLQ